MSQLPLHKPDTLDHPPARLVRIALERGIDKPDDPGLLYSADDPDIAIGDRVHAPLGRANRPTPGVVIAVGGDELLAGLDPARLKPVTKGSGHPLPESLVTLARWMADYYLCPLGMVLKTMTPAAVKKGIGRRTRIVLDRPDSPPALEPDVLPPKTRQTWSAIEALTPDPFPVEARALAAKLALSSTATINRLVRAGLLIERTEQVVRSSHRVGDLAQAPTPTDAITPSPDQLRAIEGIAATLGTFAPHLLLGITGSGKTEVYLRVIERAIALGTTALVLVPEIALTPQTTSRFQARFESVAVLHSGLTAAERHRQWVRAASGEARVVVGARSAVFAPIADLGIIIVDEEHDTSYKQDQLPRYHARDLAIKRAHIENAVVVLGSATPSLESWSNAQNDKYRFWELPNRVGGGHLPRIVVADLAREPRTKGQGRPALAIIGTRLAHELESTLNSGAQTILLLNRRGYASYLACPSPACGWTLQCDDCDAAMVLHRGSNLPKGRLVRCHHCLAERLVPGTCPLCDKRLIQLGVGTQRVEDELAARFDLHPGSGLLRLDSDTMRSARDYHDALGRFARGEIPVLLGTQMIAKGLDFPGVRLVGIINADTALFLPDFRASERTFQLVCQVAGRAGRTDDQGLVIVQTMNPLDPSIRFASNHDYKGFVRHELALRQSQGLPPATRMARIIVRDRDFDKAQASCQRIADALRSGAAPGVRVQGPAPCPIARIAEQYRIAVEVFAPSPATLREALRAVRAQGLAKSDAHTAIDVDPVSLL